jgi:hypothetical protein
VYTDIFFIFIVSHTSSSTSAAPVAEAIPSSSAPSPAIACSTCCEYGGIRMPINGQVHVIDCDKTYTHRPSSPPVAVPATGPAPGGAASARA